MECERMPNAVFQPSNGRLRCDNYLGALWRREQAGGILALRDRVGPAVAVLVAGSLTLGLSACGSSGTDTAEAGSTASATAVETMEPPAPVFEGVHAPSNGKVLETSNGKYLQSTVSEEDLQYDPAIVDPSVGVFYTPEQVEEGTKFALTFLAEEYIDSSLITGGSPYDDAAVESWWAEHQSLINPRWHDDAKTQLLEGNGGITLGTSRGEEGAETPEAVPGAEGMENIAYAPFSPEKTRILNRTIEPTMIWASTSGEPLLTVEARYMFDLAVTGTDTETGQKVAGANTVRGTMQFVLIQLPGGQWVIEGWWPQGDLANSFSFKE